MHKRILREPKGFTLIEIIAVLVILGILAVVAIPKYMDMQKQAAVSAVQGGVAALVSQASMDYASAILVSPAAGTNYTANSAGVKVGDFVGSYGIAAGGVATVAVTAGTNQGTSTYSLAAQATNFSVMSSRSFQLYQ